MVSRCCAHRAFSEHFMASDGNSLNPAPGEKRPLLQHVSHSKGLTDACVNQEKASSDPVSGLNLFQAHVLKPVV